MTLFTVFSHIDKTALLVGNVRDGVRRVRLCSDLGASSNGLGHVVALLFLEWHCVPIV